jgi:hypothetical protein
VIAAVHLTLRAEKEFQRAVERCGGFIIDRDEALRCTAAATFAAEVGDLLEAVSTSLGDDIMSLNDARMMLSTAIAELECSPSRDLLAVILASAKELLEKTTLDPASTDDDQAADLRAVAVALPILAAGRVFADRRMRA